MKVYYSADYNAARYSFDTTRKSRDIALSLSDRPIDSVELAQPKPLRRDDLLVAHDSYYVDAVLNGSPRDLAESQGFDWDEGLWTSVTASSAGIVQAGLDALRHGTIAGSLSSGLHHAGRDYGAGFCTFNGLALAAKYALKAGASKVLIVDFDAHCGGGTQSIIDGDDRIVQVDVSTNKFDSYDSTPLASLKLVTNADDYLNECHAALNRAHRLGKYDLVIYNAGMDPYEGCYVGGLKGITRELLAARERLLFQWCALRGLPVAFALAGGYVGRNLTSEQLVDLHRLTIHAAACAAKGI